MLAGSLLAALAGCAPRTIQIEQTALMPIPAAARVSGPLAPAGKLRLQGDIAYGYVPPPKAARSDETAPGHAAVTTLLRGGLSWGANKTTELSLWTDYGHRMTARPSVQGLTARQVHEAHSLWFGTSLRKGWMGKDAGFRMSFDAGMGSVPWTRYVRVTDLVKVVSEETDWFGNPRIVSDSAPTMPGPEWVEFEDGYVRRGSTVALRAGWFADVVMRITEMSNLHFGLGFQAVPFAPSFIEVTFQCNERATPTERNVNCFTDRDVDVLKAAGLVTLTAGFDVEVRDFVWVVDAWFHANQSVSVAATAPVGVAFGARY